MLSRYSVTVNDDDSGFVHLFDYTTRQYRTFTSFSAAADYVLREAGL